VTSLKTVESGKKVDKFLAVRVVRMGSWYFIEVKFIDNNRLMWKGAPKQ
jgi:hypothetical protein